MKQCHNNFLSCKLSHYSVKLINCIIIYYCIFTLHFTYILSVSCFLCSDYPGLVTPPGTPSKRNPSLPVPTDNQLSFPIRRYISETLICHVLGQPSYSLTCLLVCAVSQYIDTSMQFNSPITIEEICKKVPLNSDIVFTPNSILLLFFVLLYSLYFAVSVAHVYLCVLQQSFTRSP